MKRKPDRRLTLEEALALAGARHLDVICAGQALALQWWLDQEQITAAKFAARHHLGVSTVYDVLKIKYSPSCHLMSRVVKCFGRPLWEFDRDAELLLKGEIPLYRNSQTPSEH